MPTREEVIAELTAEGPFALRVDESLGYPLRVYAHAPAAMRDLFAEAAARHAERVFTIYEDEVLTYAQAAERVARLAHYLIGAGVAKGDRVALGMRNYPEWIIGFWATQAIGAVVVALNAWWTTEELAYALEHSEAKALLLDGERWTRIAPLAGALDPRRIVIARREDAPAGGVDFAEAVAQGPTSLPEVAIGPNDVATILYTSGTTGRPKGAYATQRNHITNTYNTLLGAQVNRRLLGVPDDFVAPQAGALQTFPFFHIGGLTGLYTSTINGSKLALMYKWDPVQAVNLIETHQLSSAGGVPIVVRQLLETATAMEKSLSSLVGVVSGGAPVPPDLINRVKDQFDARAAAGNGYGLTETTSAVIVNGGAEYFAHPDSIGRPVPTADVRIVDDNGRDLADYEIGELWIRGPNVIPGYWRDPAATEAAFGGGWFRTGDLGYRADNGFYYVVDRKKDVIIRGGENVYCAEVEAALLALDFVRDAAVVGVPHPDYGEEVAAILKIDPADQTPHRADEAREALAAHLARFKIPTKFRITDEDLPRTATGKVLKRELRERFF